MDESLPRDSWKLVVFLFVVPSLWPSFFAVESSATNATLSGCVVGVEMFKKSLDQGLAGDNVGVLLRGIKREDILRGQVLAQPGTVKTHKKFKAEV